MALALGSEVMVLLDGGHVAMLGTVLEDGPEGAVVRMDNGEVIGEYDLRVADIVCMAIFWEEALASAEWDEVD